MIRALLILLLASAGQATTLADYRFVSGSRLADSTGNGYTLTENGTAVYSDTTGVCGAYVGAVGPSTSVNFLNTPAGLTTAMNGLTTYSIQGWAYRAANSAFSVIFGDAVSNGFCLYADNSNTRFFDGTNDTVVCACIPTTTCQQWKVTSDGNYTYVYIDDMTVAKVAAPQMNWPNKAFSFGVRSGSGNGAMNGYVSAVTIKNTYDNGIPVTSTLLNNPYLKYVTTPRLGNPAPW